jgi:hypothetical protein
VAVAIVSGRLDERLDLVRGEVLPGPELGVFRPFRSNCSFYFSWRDDAQVGFCHMNRGRRTWIGGHAAAWIDRRHLAAETVNDPRYIAHTVAPSILGVTTVTDIRPLSCDTGRTRSSAPPWRTL